MLLFFLLLSSPCHTTIAFPTSLSFSHLSFIFHTHVSCPFLNLSSLFFSVTNSILTYSTPWLLCFYALSCFCSFILDYSNLYTPNKLYYWFSSLDSQRNFLRVLKWLTSSSYTILYIIGKNLFSASRVLNGRLIVCAFSTIMHNLPCMSSLLHPKLSIPRLSKLSRGIVCEVQVCEASEITTSSRQAR